MLVNNYKTSDVTSFKLTSGEEIICRIKESGPDGWVVTKAMTIMMQQNGLGLVPSMFSMEENGDMFLSKNGVIAHAKSDPALASKYREKTSGLVTGI